MEMEVGKADVKREAILSLIKKLQQLMLAEDEGNGEISVEIETEKGNNNEMMDSAEEAETETAMEGGGGETSLEEKFPGEESSLEEKMKAFFAEKAEPLPGKKTRMGGMMAMGMPPPRAKRSSMG